MLVNLRFTLPDEQDEYDTLMNGAKYLSALLEVEAQFRAHRKHGAGPVTEEVFHQILRDSGVEL